MTNANDKAYPVFEYSTGGITKLEYFAAMAMQGYAANSIAYKGAHEVELAKYSVGLAKALIAELNKE